MNPGLANGGARSRNHKKMRFGHILEVRIALHTNAVWLIFWTETEYILIHFMENSTIA